MLTQAERVKRSVAAIKSRAMMKNPKNIRNTNEVYSKMGNISIEK